MHKPCIWNNVAQVRAVPSTHTLEHCIHRSLNRPQLPVLTLGNTGSHCVGPQQGSSQYSYWNTGSHCVGPSTWQFWGAPSTHTLGYIIGKPELALTIWKWPYCFVSLTTTNYSTFNLILINIHILITKMLSFCARINQYCQSHTFMSIRLQTSTKNHDSKSCP